MNSFLDDLQSLCAVLALMALVFALFIGIEKLIKAKAYRLRNKRHALETFESRWRISRG